MLTTTENVSRSLEASGFFDVSTCLSPASIDDDVDDSLSCLGSVGDDSDVGDAGDVGDVGDVDDVDVVNAIILLLLLLSSSLKIDSPPSLETSLNVLGLLLDGNANDGDGNAMDGDSAKLLLLS